MDSMIALAMFINAMAALGALAYAFRYKNEQCGLALILLVCCIALGSFAHAVQIVTRNAFAFDVVGRLASAAALAPWLLLLYTLNRAKLVTLAGILPPVLLTACFAVLAVSGALLNATALYIYWGCASAALCAGAAVIFFHTIGKEHYLSASAALLSALLVASAGLGWIYYLGALPVNLMHVTMLAAALLILGRFMHYMMDMLPGLNKAVVENMADAVIVLDHRNAIVDANSAARRMLDGDAAQHFSPAAMALKGWPDIAANAYMETRDPFTLVQNGVERHFNMHRTPIFDPANTLQGQLMVIQEITHLKRAEQLLEHASTHDELTGLPNRFLFQERLQNELDINERLNRHIAIIQINIDNLQSINDTLSLTAGDMLILSLAIRLHEKLRKVDTLTRYSGDEFLIIMPQIQNPQMHMSGLVNRLFETVSQPFDISGRQVHATFSMGITVSPDDGVTVDDLLSNANMALAFSKASGKNRYSFYDTQMSHHTRERWHLADDLRKAAQEGQFSLLFQPQVRIEEGATDTGVIVGVESLLRWNHPVRGPVHPDQFIPIAEEFNLIGDIGEWVLSESIKQLAAFIRMGYADLRMSINVSVKQLYSAELPQITERLLKEHNVPAANVELEITESIALSDNPTLLGNIRRMRELGVHFAMDDFGMGHSSLVYLRNFPLNKLKLDKSLSVGAMEDTRSGAVVHSIAVLCDSLNINMVVEFVENDQHLKLLLSLGCRIFQGYLFSKPVTSDSLPRMLDMYGMQPAHIKTLSMRRGAVK